MPREALTDEQRAALRRDRQRRYYEKNKEKCIAASLASKAKKADQYKAAQAEYRKNNADKIKASGLLYRASNKSRIAQSVANWREENRDRFDAYQRKYRAINSEKLTAKKRAWEKENTGRAKAWRSEYDAKTSEMRRIREINRRAAKKASSGVLSPGLPKKLLMLQKNRCACCSSDLLTTGFHLDHIDPLSRGGLHEDKNIQLLCPPCNQSKHAKNPVDFMQERGFLL